MNKKDSLNISCDLITQRDKELVKSWHPKVNVDEIIGVEKKGNLKVIKLTNGGIVNIPGCTRKEALDRLQKEDIVAEIFG